MSISDLRKALAKPEYFNLLINKSILTGCSAEAVNAILDNCLEDDNGDVYLPIRKLYSLEVELDQLLEVSEEQQKAAESLTRIAMAIAQKETEDDIAQGNPKVLNKRVKEVENKIKAAIDNNLTLASLPMKWMPYYLPLNNCVARIISGNTDKRSVVYVLANRVDEDVDWESMQLGNNLIKAIASQFIAKEQSGWKVEESDTAESLGELSIKEEIQSLKEQINQLTGIVSTMISSDGEYTPTTITVNSKKLQPV